MLAERLRIVDNHLACLALWPIAPCVAEANDAENLQQGNVRYPRKMLRDAKEAADWEGIGYSDYFRSALKARLRETEVKRAEYERKAKGESDPRKS